MTREMLLSTLLTEYEDGNATGWPAELAWLWTQDGDRMLTLVRDIAANGIQAPIMLGPDASIWDGHHQIAAAIALRLEVVPVTSPDKTE